MSDALMNARYVEIPIDKEHEVIAWFERWGKSDCSKLDMIGRQGILDAAKELVAVLGYEGKGDELETMKDKVEELEQQLSEADREIEDLEQQIKELEENVNGKG